MEENAEINRETPIGLFNFAASYLKAANHLVSGIVDDKLFLPFNAPVSLLIGHGFEILLKAFLRSKGVEEPKLKRLSHNLLKLLRAADCYGLQVEISVQERGHLSLLNDQFGKPPYLIRYLVSGAIMAHDDKVILGLAKRIQHAIGPDIVGKTAWKNQQKQFL